MVNFKHGLARTPEFDAWRQMIYRCTDPNHIQYCNYGARGIRVCEEWLQDPRPFIDHIGPRPSPKHSVDREDNDKSYEPGNVKWSTKNQQALNRRSRATSDTPGVKIYKATGLWSVITPCHPKTKKFKWLGRKFQSQDEAVEVREAWLKVNWPSYPEGEPLSSW